LNEEEAQFISGLSNPIDAVADLLSLAPTAVIKRGSSGALGQSRGSPLVQVQAEFSRVVDTTGAGDAFAAGFIQVWGGGGDLSDALANGARLGAKCVAAIGSRPIL
jgi:sugar/nucleoside kinase (ribokinase family)